LRSLLHDSVVCRVVLDLLLLLLEEVFRPNLIILQIDVVRELVVEVNLARLMVFLGEFVVSLCTADLLFVECCVWIVAFILVISLSIFLHQWFWIEQPLGLLFHKWIKSFPLFSVRWFWQLPEHFCHDSQEHWVAINCEIHGQYIQHNKIDHQTFHLFLRNTHSKEVSQSQTSWFVESIIMEEPWNSFHLTTSWIAIE